MGEKFFVIFSICALGNREKIKAIQCSSYQDVTNSNVKCPNNYKYKQINATLNVNSRRQHSPVVALLGNMLLELA